MDYAQNRELLTSDVATLRSQLPSDKPELVCTPETDIVIEGYPRSSNSFTYDMLRVLYEKSDTPWLRIAHHTHRVQNVMIGLKLGKPVIALIREPLDAILSFMIFFDNKVNVERAAARYRDFYEPVYIHQSSLSVVRFETVTTNFNCVLDEVNRLTNCTVPRSRNLVADVEIAQNRARNRAKLNHGQKFVSRVASPNAEREILKVNKKLEVKAYLDAHPEIETLYDAIVARDGVI